MILSLLLEQYTGDRTPLLYPEKTTSLHPMDLVINEFILAEDCPRWFGIISSYIRTKARPLPLLISRRKKKLSTSRMTCLMTKNNLILDDFPPANFVAGLTYLLYCTLWLHFISYSRMIVIHLFSHHHSSDYQISSHQYPTPSSMHPTLAVDPVCHFVAR